MSQRKIALYISSPDISVEKRAEIQHTFDTSSDSPSVPPQPGWIELVPNSQSWSIGKSPQEINQRHTAQYAPRYSRRPLIILDARTAKDGSVLVVSPVISEETDTWEHRELRFVPQRVPAAAVNLVIGNQSLDELAYHVDDDGVWRWFKNSTVPNPDE